MLPQRAAQSFCAIRCNVPRRLRDCGDFEGLALRIRADTNLYTVNVQAKSFFPDDLYQVLPRRALDC